jgi:hypothetical protein
MDSSLTIEDNNAISQFSWDAFDEAFKVLLKQKIMDSRPVYPPQVVFHRDFLPTADKILYSWCKPIVNEDIISKYPREDDMYQWTF